LRNADGIEAAADLRIGRYRWLICALLFAATSINYVDRQIIGVLKPTLQIEFGWSESYFGDVVFWFQAAYAVGYLASGRIIDKIGARLGYAAVVVVWTAAHIAHAFVGSANGFIAARFALGLGESGNFPAAIKTVTEWFPNKERALATGIFNSGTSIGAILAPLFIPWILNHLGWRWSFFITGALGFVWLVPWLIFYRRPEEHKYCSPSELAYIQKDSSPSLFSTQYFPLSSTYSGT